MKEEIIFQYSTGNSVCEFPHGSEMRYFRLLREHPEVVGFNQPVCEHTVAFACVLAYCR